MSSVYQSVEEMDCLKMKTCSPSIYGLWQKPFVKEVSSIFVTGSFAQTNVARSFSWKYSLQLYRVRHSVLNNCLQRKYVKALIVSAPWDVLNINILIALFLLVIFFYTYFITLYMAFVTETFTHTNVCR